MFEKIHTKWYTLSKKQKIETVGIKPCKTKSFLPSHPKQDIP